MMLSMNSRCQRIRSSIRLILSGRSTKANSIFTSPLIDYNCLSRGSHHVNQKSFTLQTCRVSSSCTLHGGQSRLPSNFLPTLKSRHPDLKISTNTYDLDAHGHGESYHPSSPPDAVIYPSSVEEIQDILSLCCRESAERNDNQEVTFVDVVSVIPYGAGTSVEGHLNMLIPEDVMITQVPSSMFVEYDGSDSYRKVITRRKGGISIDMSNFQQIGEVKTGDLFVKVGPGVSRNTLNNSLRHSGLQFMVDPGANASIGGMIACGASGTAAVKYGTMRENLLALEAIIPSTKVLPSHDNALDNTCRPEIVNCGTTALKSSAGYNTTALFNGSEGTLGVIIGATVKIHPIYNHVIAAVCAFDDLYDAAEAVTCIKGMGIPISRIELLDKVSIQAFNKYLQDASELDTTKLSQMEVKPTLFLEFSGHSNAAVNEDLSAAQSVCLEFNGTNFLSASDDATRQKLWAARHRLYYSSISLKEGATPRSTFLTDACVPLSHFADVLVATALDVKEFDVIGPCFGHAGDGNFHCIMPMSEDDSDEYKNRVFQVNENLIKRVIGVGGTCTGEHGVGYGKKKYLEGMYGVGGVNLMKSLKKSLDPWNIMNPGKIVDI